MADSQEDDDLLDLECEVLTPTNLSHCHGFCCGADEWDADLNDFLQNDAVWQGELRLNTTYVFSARGKPVAYVALAAAQVRKFGRVKTPYEWAPALLIGQFAVHETRQSQGVGAQILGWIRDLARNLPIGCRLLVVHVDVSNSEALRFYKKEGFVCPPNMRGKESQLMVYDLVNEIVE